MFYEGNFWKTPECHQEAAASLPFCSPCDNNYPSPLCELGPPFCFPLEGACIIWACLSCKYVKCLLLASVAWGGLYSSLLECDCVSLLSPSLLQT